MFAVVWFGESYSIVLLNEVELGSTSDEKELPHGPNSVWPVIKPLDDRDPGSHAGSR